MNKLFTSTLLTVVAVPFLMAAPSAAKKTQNQAPAATAPAGTDTQSTAPKAKAKKHVKKTKNTMSSTAAPTTPSQK